MIHRPLDAVLPSFCRTQLTAVNGFFDEADSISRDRLMKRCIQCIGKMVELIMKFRAHRHDQSDQSHNNIFDVTYDILIKSPIETVRRIYGHFDLRWSNEFEAAMEA
ncbi:unnamed protein product [Rotaria magnacalcarata]|nr:unnamed protein product [Rotaria magnacalcarata]